MAVRALHPIRRTRPSPRSEDPVGLRLREVATLRPDRAAPTPNRGTQAHRQEAQVRPSARHPGASAEGATCADGGHRRVIRIVVCDDHAVVRAGLQRLLDSIEGIDVVATAVDGQDGVEVATRLRPDVVLMDLSMPRLDGVAATQQIATAAPDTRVVVLMSLHHRARLSSAMAAGARGCVLKDATPAQLVDAIRAAADARPAT
jgi:CheY-like chemotaxis protein